jgi:5-methylcytosine-specific restriction endonuclease McrA
MKKTLLQRCQTTLSSMKSRARKSGATVTFTAEDLVCKVPASCIWCQRRLTPSVINFDHDVPLARGGNWSLENLFAICGSCNRRKGTLDSREFRKLLQKLQELTDELGSDYVMKNVLKRLAAGGAWIHS